MESISTNTLVIGKSGVGKSSLLNYIFGIEVEKTGSGEPVTKEGIYEHSYKYSEDILINIYDTWGLEANQAEKWKKLIFDEVEKHDCIDINEWFHTIIYCFSAKSARVENFEKEIISELTKKGNKLIVVFTHSDAPNVEKSMVAMKRELLSIGIAEDNIISVCSVSKTLLNGKVSLPFGVENVLVSIINNLWVMIRSKIPIVLENYAKSEMDSWKTRCFDYVEKNVNIWNSGSEKMIKSFNKFASQSLEEVMIDIKIFFETKSDEYFCYYFKISNEFALATDDESQRLYNVKKITVYPREFTDRIVDYFGTLVMSFIPLVNLLVPLALKEKRKDDFKKSIDDICDQVMEELRIEIDRINADLENLADDGEEEEHAEDQTRKSKNKEHILGIDFGTTNSRVAVFTEGKIVVISDGEGNKVTPSVVAFMNDGRRLVGEAAKKQMSINPEKTFAPILRHLATESNYYVNDRKYAPEEIAAIILRKLRTDAETFMDETITKAVIAVPSYFNHSQLQAIKNAGRIAGLEVLRLIDATSAAALSYDYKIDDYETIMVCDMGGSTTDVSILELGDGVYEVKATNGNNYLGGEDFDQRIVDWMADEFYQTHRFNLKNDKIAAGRLKEAAEKAKIELSTVAQTEIKIPFIRIMEDEQEHLEVSLTRKKFEELTSDLIRNALVPIEKVIKGAYISSNELDKVLLIGGSTKIPALHEAIEKLVGDKVCKRYNSDECVVKGAAISAGTLSGDVVDVLLLDTLNLSLGMETTGGVFTRFIDQNTTIPTKKSLTFSTDKDNQTVFEIHVLQGEREMAKDNITLDRFQLTGIPAARRGLPQIEVIFDIDANGILNASAKDLGTGKSQNIVVKPKTNMSEDEVEQAVREAEAYYSVSQ